jgi:Cupin-like domain
MSSGVSSLAKVPRLPIDQWEKAADTYVGQRQAALVEAAFGDTEAVRTWSPEFLMRRFGEVEVLGRFEMPPGVRVGRCPTQTFRSYFKDLPLAEFIRHMQVHSFCYVPQAPIDKFDGLVDQLDLGRLVEPPYTIKLWLGSGTRTPLHFDGADKYLIQVHGTKRAILEPPTSSARLYVREDEPHKSLVDPLRIDLERFPRYTGADRCEAVLSPGDALYIPPGWFHDILADDGSISVNVWHGNSIPYPGGKR